MHNNMSRSARKEAMCGRMDFKRGKNRNNIEDDRLSSLPDDLIHKILPLISLQQTIGMSALSSRWRFIWTSMPYLNFNELYPTKARFSKFVSNVLSRRNDQIQVSSLNLVLWRIFCGHSVGRILNYASSHNVQQLSVKYYRQQCNNYIGVPLSLFSSRSLKHLTLPAGFYASSITLSLGSWDLPTLTTLHLDGISLCDDNTDKCAGLFSKCPNLKILSLRGFKMKGTNVLNISHPRLKDLTINDFQGGKHLVISALGLTSFVMTNDYPTQLSTQGFPSLEKVDLCINDPQLEDAPKIVCLLQQFHNVKFLTLNFGILELFSSSMEPITHQPSLFANLKILSFSRRYQTWVYLEVRAHEESTTSTEMKNYIPESSPSAVFALVSRKEIRVMREIISAEVFMEDLRKMIKMCEKKVTNKARMEGRKRKMLIDSKVEWAQSPLEILQSRFGEIMAQIEQRKSEGFSCSYALKDCTSETSCMISRLQQIEGLVNELPASKRAVMQLRFSSLCEEASIFMNEMMDRIMIQSYYNKTSHFDTNQSSLAKKT